MLKSPCPTVSQNYAARLRIEQNRIQFEVLSLNKKLFTRIDWSLVFHQQQRALVLLNNWIRRQCKDPLDTISLRVQVHPIATVQQLLEQCKRGRYPADVPDDVLEVYTLPYRYVRYGNQALPSIAERNGRYVVRYPQSVRNNTHFAKDAALLPEEVFRNGLTIEKDELVRIHFYDGSLYDEEHTYVCISASQLPEIDRLVTKSVYMGLAVTTLETAALMVPGRFITAAIQRTGRSILLGTLLGLSELTPELVSQGTLHPVMQTTVRSATGAVVAQTLEQTAVRAAAEGATEQVVASTAARAGVSAPVQLGSQTAAALGGKVAAVGTAEGVGAQILEAPSVNAPTARGAKGAVYTPRIAGGDAPRVVQQGNAVYRRNPIGGAGRNPARRDCARSH